MYKDDKQPCGTNGQHNLSLDYLCPVRVVRNPGLRSRSRRAELRRPRGRLCDDKRLMACERCPCPDRCPQWPAYCQWVLADPIDPVHVRHVCRDPNAPVYPKPAVQFISFLGALKTWVKAGAPVADRTERARRRGICEACDKYDKSQSRCLVCGCATAIKPFLLTASCPLGKWNLP